MSGDRARNVALRRPLRRVVAIASARLDGVISDQLARPEPDFDPFAALSPAVYGIVHQPPVPR